jgi:enterochelin esterase-like enzyme
MKTILQLLLLMFALTAMAQPLPKVSSGIIQRHHVSSKYVEARNVDVWLPQSYSAKKKHAVLYMHDGQMLFDSTTTWNRSAWDVDDALGRLLAQERIREVIVVGVWNNGAKRHIEYFPQKPFERLSKSLQDSLFAANRSNGALPEISGR